MSSKSLVKIQIQIYFGFSVPHKCSLAKKNHQTELTTGANNQFVAKRETGIPKVETNNPQRKPITPRMTYLTKDM